MQGLGDGQEGHAAEDLARVGLCAWHCRCADYARVKNVAGCGNRNVGFVSVVVMWSGTENEICG